MGLKLVNLWMTAAWREAQRAGAPETDIDHLYLGLIAIGGSAARLLGRHGISLESARRRVAESQDADLASLGIDASGVRPPRVPPLQAMISRTLPTTKPAEALLTRALKGSDTYDLLKTLLEEPSGVTRRLVHADGVTPQDLAPGLREGAEDPFSPETVDADPALLSAPARAQRLTRFLPVPAARAAEALSESDSLSWWAYDPEKSQVSADGERVTHRHGQKTMTLRLHHTRHQVDDTHVVTWLQEALDGPHAGQVLLYDRFEFSPAPGGCVMTRTAGRRSFGILGRLLAPVNDRLSGLGMLYSTTVIGYGVSEA